jgi:hypothetical protein
MAKKEAGNYYGTLVEAGVDTLKNSKKTPFLYLNFRITHFFDGTGWVEVPEVFDRDIKFFLSDAAWPYTEKDLELFGFNGDFENPKFKDQFYQGTELLCSLDNSDTDGKSYENWELPGTSRNGVKERVAPPKEALQRFNARWKTNSSTRQAPATGRPAVSTMPDAPPIGGPDNDDIPY